MAKSSAEPEAEVIKQDCIAMLRTLRMKAAAKWDATKRVGQLRERYDEEEI